jgi:lysophospholipase L1-like esterase
MNFRTELNIPATSHPIFYGQKIYFIGSCFSENIGSLMQKYKFCTIVNPFGTLYDPVSLSGAILHIIDKKPPTPQGFVSQNEVFFHTDYHSCLSDTDQECLRRRIIEKTAEAHDFLKKSDYIFITLGTALGWKTSDKLSHVANCHKLPGEMFSRYEISVKEGFAALQSMIEKIQSFNPDVQIVFTVSPVRHTRSGIIENSRSKSRLVQMVDYIQKNNPSVLYFPAYEWMMDDLRDYRFYKSDLVHPNESAIAYIWEKFQNCYFTSETQALAKRILKVVKSAEHKVMHEKTKAYREFCSTHLAEINNIQSIYPYIDFTTEVKFFEQNTDE